MSTTFSLETDRYKYEFDTKWEQIKKSKSSVRLLYGVSTAVLVRNKTDNNPHKDEQQLLLFGGNTDVVESCSINNLIHSDNFQWKELTRMPKELDGCAAVSLIDDDDDYIVYVFGGFNINEGIQNKVYKYNVHQNVWTEEDLPSMNTKRSSLAGVGIKKCLYAIGGEDENGETLDTVEYNDTDNDSAGWIILKAKMKTKRYGCCAVVINNIIYVIGGRDENNNYLNTIEMYDTTLSDENGEWVEISSTMSTGRYRAAAVALEHYIIIIGGYNLNDGKLNTIEVFDTKTNKFETNDNNLFPTMTTAYYGCTAVLTSSNDSGSAFDKRIVFVGGDNDGTSLEMINIKSLRVLSTTTRSQNIYGDHEKGKDLLNVSIIASALADTIAYKDLNTPFVLGILGNWGSGKSFTFNLIKERLKSIQKSNYSVKDFQYCGHIYTINFNAWTYSKVNLWASLMNEILTSLNTQLELERLLKDIFGKELRKDVSLIDMMEKIPEEDFEYLDEMLKGKLPDERNQETKRKLKGAIRNNKNATEALAVAIDDTYLEDKKLLWTRKSQLAWERVTSKSFAKRLTPGVQRILIRAYDRHKIKIKANDTQDETLDFQDATDNLKLLQTCEICEFFYRIYLFVEGGSLTPQWLAFFCAAILVTIMVPLLMKQYQAIFTAVVPILSAVITRYKDCFNQAKGAYDIFLEAGETANFEINTLEEMEANANASTIAESKRKISDIESRLIVREGDSINDVVKKRLETKYYENELGTLHRAQSDLQSLSSAMKRNEKLGKSGEKIFPRGKPRIVLVIDDLDRCPPNKVVETLEAVQLLVKTDLFVVIVAIDVEYVTLSLEKAYKDVLTKSTHPSGIDYIEKIIQLPYQMSPIGEEAMQQYLEGQMKTEPKKKNDALEKQPPSINQSKDEKENKDYEIGKNIEEHQDDEDTNNSVDDEAKKSGAREEEKNEQEYQEYDGSDRTEKNPTEEAGSDTNEKNPTEEILFSDDELLNLTKSCLLAEVSPRSGKRLINVFKLLKDIWRRSNIEPTEIEKGLYVLLLSMCASPSYKMKAAAGLVFNVAKQKDNGQENETSTKSIRSIVLESLDEHTKEGRRFMNSYDEIVTNTRNKDLTIEDSNIRKNILLVSCFTFIGCSSKFHQPAQKNERDM